MRPRTTLLVFATILCATGTVLSSSGCERNEDGSTRILLRARAPERGNWSPQEIRVERGRPVTIVVRNVDIATHSFYLPALGLNSGPLKPGETKEVTFTPEFEGEYLFVCAVWCSDYHMYERGWLIVD